MGDFNWNTRMEITKKRNEALEKRIQHLKGKDRELAFLLKDGKLAGSQILLGITRQFYEDKNKRPSQWFIGAEENGTSGVRKAVMNVLKPELKSRRDFLDGFVPRAYQASFLYIIDKLNRFPFSLGWSRRTVRTKGYGPSIYQVFSVLMTYEKLFYCGERLEDYILRRLDEEMLDYVRNDWHFNPGFSYLYAAEIDRGNQAVIGALRELILSESNTAYLDREMILGIVRSDNEELKELLCRLLLADCAR